MGKIFTNKLSLEWWTGQQVASPSRQACFWGFCVLMWGNGPLLGSMVRWTCWLGSVLIWAPSWTPQSPLIGWNGSLCSPDPEVSLVELCSWVELKSGLHLSWLGRASGCALQPDGAIGSTPCSCMSAGQNSPLDKDSGCASQIRQSLPSTSCSWAEPQAGLADCT